MSEKVIIEEVSNGYILEFTEHALDIENEDDKRKKKLFVDDIFMPCTNTGDIDKVIHNERLACLNKVFEEIKIIMGFID